MNTNIVLVGDAFLDNYHFLESSDVDLKYSLEKLGYKVDNLATQDADVFNIKKGISVSQDHIRNRKYKYNLICDKLYPFKILADKYKLVDNFPSVNNIFEDDDDSKDKCDLLVLSIGGNDIKKSSYKLLGGCDFFIASVLTEDFVNNYVDIIKSVKKFCHKVVLISPHIPYLGPGSSYGIFGNISGPIISRWTSFIKNLAIKFDIPVIDLSLTVDPNNRSHYGIADIYPGNITSRCIAECVSHINKNYHGYSVYYCPNCDFTRISEL